MRVFESYIKSSDVPPQSDSGGGLARELAVLFGGVGDGLGSAVERKIDQAPVTALEIAGAAGIGYLLGRAQTGPGLLKLGAKVAGLGLTYAAVKDINTVAMKVIPALTDTWNSPNNIEENKQVVGRWMAPFLLDSLIVVGMGSLGASAGHRDYDIRNLASQLGQQHQGSVFRVATIKGNGTAFAVTADGTLATAFHVVSSSCANRILVRNSTGVDVLASAHIALPVEDVAILKMPESTRPLKLADSTVSLPVSESKGLPGAALGFPGQEFSSRPGRFSTFIPTRHNIVAFEEQPARLIFGARTAPGMSGGPVIDAAGQVIGINKSGFRKFPGEPDALASPVENLDKLLNLAARAEACGSTISVEAAAARFGLDESEVIRRLKAGRMEGFLQAEPQYSTADLPSAAPLTRWTWRVLVDRSVGL